MLAPTYLECVTNVPTLKGKVNIFVESTVHFFNDKNTFKNKAVDDNFRYPNTEFNGLVAPCVETTDKMALGKGFKVMNEEKKNEDIMPENIESLIKKLMK